VVAAGDRRRLCFAQTVHQRVGVAVRQPPPGSVPPVDQRDPQRPVLVRQAADLPVLPLDDDQDDQVAGRVRLETSRLDSPPRKNPAKAASAPSEESKPRRGSPPYGAMSV
jgi:hypothetical protein